MEGSLKSYDFALAVVEGSKNVSTVSLRFEGKRDGVSFLRF